MNLRLLSTSRARVCDRDLKPWFIKRVWGWFGVFCGTEMVVAVKILAKLCFEFVVFPRENCRMLPKFYSSSHVERLLIVNLFCIIMNMSAQEDKAVNLRGLKKYTASTVAERMGYWMTKSVSELSVAEADDSLSVLDLIIIRSLLSDYKYAKLKNLDALLNRVIGTPMSHVNINKTVNSDKPVQISLIGVDVNDENSLQALSDLKESASDEESGS